MDRNASRYLLAFRERQRQSRAAPRGWTNSTVWEVQSHARNKPLVLGLIAIEFIRRISSLERMAEREAVNPY